MWQIYEYNALVKQLHKIPTEVLKRYEKWKDIAAISGPEGLKLIKGFHDEALKGERKGSRSSRLGKRYRLIYKIENKRLYVKVIDITPHDYRSK